MTLSLLCCCETVVVVVVGVVTAFALAGGMKLSAAIKVAKNELLQNELPAKSRRPASVAHSSMRASPKNDFGNPCTSKHSLPVRMRPTFSTCGREDGVKHVSTPARQLAARQPGSQAGRQPGSWHSDRHAA
jgi:hypothetical protein